MSKPCGYLLQAADVKLSADEALSYLTEAYPRPRCQHQTNSVIRQACSDVTTCDPFNNCEGRSHHLHTPFPPFSPSLIIPMVSVDVKHHVHSRN